ncbi:MAG: hypothetical protein JSS49_24210 [Planctomycetes bacterium]|nr:hypothetical protein [Planctomycetota bacterium]
MKNNILALVAAVAGATVGYFGFGWMLKQGFYALILPGAFAGLAASHFHSKSIAVSIASGLVALAAGLLAECHFHPWIKDQSLTYFLAHVHQLKPLTLIMLSVGTIMGFWFPFAHRNDAGRAK